MKEGFSMQQKVSDFMKENNLVSKGDTVVIGVSGGPDSLALLHYFVQIKDMWQLNLIAAHVDHMFRGDESKQDLLFVEEVCRLYRIKCESISIDVSSYKKETGKSTQVAARDCRYQFYEKVMEKYQADALALGHHGDDQVETILMRLVRGAVGSGYGGMRIKRPFMTGMIIRPFLCVTKAEIEAYCHENNLTPRIDASNETDAYTRNRFRKILPLLKKENAQVHEKFLQFSTVLMEDEQFLQDLAEKELEKIMKVRGKDMVIISISFFQSAPKPLQRRMIQLILRYLYIQIPESLSSIHIANILSFFQRAHPSGELNLPHGLRLIRTYDDGIFTFHGHMENKKISKPLSFLTDTAWEDGVFSVEIVSEKEIQKTNNCFICPLSAISLPIIIRTRKNGDKMTLKGMKGTKKIKDIFIDNKIAKEDRERWPVVVDSRGELLWLPYLKKSSLEESTAESYVLICYTARRKIVDDER